MFKQTFFLSQKEGSLIVYNRQTEKFVFHYEFLFGDEKIQSDHDEICSEIESWGLNEKEFFCEPPINKIGVYEIYFLDA